MDRVTDVVVTTCERLDLLKRSLQYIWERTTTPYRLQVIDDASRTGNAEYLQELQRDGKIARARLHTRRVGISSHLRSLHKITSSDPIVFTDDDILCPKLDPDWLARGLTEMERYPKLGLLALNTPACNIRRSRGRVRPEGNVSFCRNVPGSFVFARQAVLETCCPPGDPESPVKKMCAIAKSEGWRVGYLTHVYCQHIGEVSVRNRKDISNDLKRVLPIDDETLEPPERWAR